MFRSGNGSGRRPVGRQHVPCNGRDRSRIALIKPMVETLADALLSRQQHAFQERQMLQYSLGLPLLLPVWLPGPNHPRLCRFAASDMVSV